MAIIRWDNKALKQISKIDTRYKGKILLAIEQLKNFPSVELDLIRLKGTQNQFRIRVGFYRVLFELVDGEPKIITIQAIKKRDEQTYH